MKVTRPISEVIRGCMKNDPACQAELVHGYSEFLMAICRRYVLDVETAKDLVQESLIKILGNIQKYNSVIGPLESWMATIAIRTCLNALEKKKVKTVDLDIVTEQQVQFDAKILQHLSMQELYVLIHLLPSKYNVVFNLYIIDGYSHKEISELLKIEEVTSRSRLSRAKYMLRKTIERIRKKESCIKTV